MAKTHLTEYVTQNYENLRGFQQERLLVEVASLIDQAMKDKMVNRTQLAELLGVTKGRVTQCLGGERNLTLRTLADIFTALGKSLLLQTEDVWASLADWESIPNLPAEIKPARPTTTYSSNIADGGDGYEYSIAA
ncbi:MAG TPA: helix-turn-helix transcriptional regulator [Pirellulales bacterium]|nr:helix-turn-helix transcriptional regulator [Pirellulales bacterium]